MVEQEEGIIDTQSSEQFEGEAASKLANRKVEGASRVTQAFSKAVNGRLAKMLLVANYQDMRDDMLKKLTSVSAQAQDALNQSEWYFKRREHSRDREETLKKQSYTQVPNTQYNSNTQERPKTAVKRMTPKEIKQRNMTFYHVNKINAKRAKELKPPPYKPPQGSR